MRVTVISYLAKQDLIDQHLLGSQRFEDNSLSTCTKILYKSKSTNLMLSYFKTWTKMIGSLLCFVITVLIVKSEAAWHQVWEDDFNGNSLNEADWKYEEGCSG